MKRIIDYLLDAFIWIYSLFLCSIALPAALGLIVVTGALASFTIERLNNKLGAWQYFIYLIVGIFLKTQWLDKKDKKG